MNDSLSTKLKRKRRRTVLLIAAVLACLTFTGLSLNFEQADYTASLQKEVDSAIALLESAQANQGNANDQYAPYTVLEYQNAIGQARLIAQSDTSTYTQKQTAYQTLKEQTAAFENAQNKNSFSAQQLKESADAQTPLSFAAELEIGTATVVVTPAAGTVFSDLNPTLQPDGPFTSLVRSTCEKYGLDGFAFTLLQDGTFCCDVRLELELPSGQNSGSLYYYDRESNGLQLVDSSLVADEGSRVSIPLAKGGDYFFAFSAQQQPAASSSQTASSASSPSGTVTTVQNSTVSSSQSAPPASDTTSSSSSSSSVTQQPSAVSPPSSSLPMQPSPTAQPAEVTVSLEIRCDPLANDPSKLTDPAKKDYVPADGTILAKTEYKMPVGSTVFDLLTQVCKNNNIHIEYSFYSGFQSYYIEGINHLYEFDGGQLSGWLYRINGIFPGYGCSAYTLSDGDAVSLLYTCNGGEDVGNYWNGQ